MRAKRSRQRLFEHDRLPCLSHKPYALSIRDVCRDLAEKTLCVESFNALAKRDQRSFRFVNQYKKMSALADQCNVNAANRLLLCSGFMIT